MSNRTRMDNLVILGQAGVEIMKDGRPSVCTVAFSKEYGLVRLYPTPMDAPLRRWNLVSVEVEKNERDPRPESWKFVGSKSDYSTLKDRIRFVGKHDRHQSIDLLNRLSNDCIEELNAQRKSLGLLTPEILDVYLEERPTEQYDPSTIQTSLLDPKKEACLPSKERFKYQLRVKFRCSDRCTARSHHDQQVLEWGVYEWFRKNEGEEEKVIDNIRLLDEDYDRWLLVGNSLSHPRSFMVISVFRFKKEKEGPAISGISKERTLNSFS